MAEMTIGDRAVLFDDGDAELLALYHWNLHPGLNTTYARGYRRFKDGQVYMHRLLTGARKGEEVDHANGNGLDNRRQNLRVCDHCQNGANRHHVASATGVKGVHFERQTGRWRAEITWRGKRYKLGRFSTLSEAADAYATKASELHGEFARPVHAINSK